jgi:hypothetical protein
MMRALYRWLLRLHPRPFRERFEEEMLYGFDDRPDKADGLWLIWDATLSLFRQWVLRRPYWVRRSHHLPSPDGTPLFAIIEDIRPGPAPLLFGAMVSLMTFAAIVSVSELGGGSSLGRGLFATGVRHSLSGAAQTASGPLATPAGRRLAEWVAAYNTGDFTMLRRFASVRLEGDVQKWREEFDRFGPFGLGVVIEHSEPHLIVVMTHVAGGQWRRIFLEVQTRASHLITSISIEHIGGDPCIPSRTRYC